jgi:tetratricopeptide (TPR) repeat protein
VKSEQKREVFRLQLVERPNRSVETRAIGYAHDTVALPFELEELAGLLADGAFTQVGQALYEVLFPEGGVRDSLAEALVVTRAERQPLAVQLHLEAESPTLARYPWELIHDGGSFLVADGVVALARYIDYAQALVPATIQMPLRVLVVSPRPVDLAYGDGRLAGASLPPMLAALEPMRQQGLVHVDLLTPPTYASLRQVLSHEAYQILHFDGPSGFGALEADRAEAYLVFEDEQGAACPTDGHTLYNALFLSKVRLAVLIPPFPEGGRPGPTALAGLAPALVKAGVPAIVAMQYALEQEQNERFAAQLYRSLVDLTPLGTAVAHARGQLLPPESTRFAPAIYLQDKEGSGELFAGRAEATSPRPLTRVPSAPGPISAGYRPDPVFVDRAQAVIQTLSALAGSGSRICLWGFGGVGKTAVAREVVRRGAWRFPGGIVWLSLQGGRSLAGILDEIAGFLGRSSLAPRLEEATRQVSNLLTERLAASGGEMLLVLDNYEDVAGDPDLKDFLDSLPQGIRVLATSRHEPPADAWRTVELRTMGAADIEQILRQRIRVGQIPLATGDEPLLSEISLLLDGYPLGVDLVVSLARTCPWAHICDELRAQPPPPLQAILRTTIAEALGEEDRGVAARLSVLRGPFDAAAIARLSGTATWLPHVQRLRELALLSFDRNVYSFDVPVREYLYTLLAPEEAQECHEQAYQYFARRRDLDGLVEAYQHAVAAGRYQAARDLLRDRLIDALLNAGRYHQLLGLLEAALATPEAFDERFLLSRATIQRILGQLPEALQSLEQLLAVPDLSVPGRALALHEQGRIYYELDDEERGDHQQALDLYAQALAIYEDLPAASTLDRDRRRWLDAELAALFQDIAIVYQYALARPEDLAFARQLYATSAGFWQGLRDAVSRAISEKQRAEILRAGGPADKAEAKRIYRQAMQTFKRKGLQRYYADTLLQLGKIYQDERGYKHALRRFQEYEEIQRSLGLEREEAMAWKHQGEIHQEAGYRGRSVKQAVALYDRALDRLARYGDRWSRRAVVATLLRRGEAKLELGLADQAREDLQAALQHAIALGTRGEDFDVRRLSESDRRRLVWAYCALARATASLDDGETNDGLLAPVLETSKSLGHEVEAAASSELDCRALLQLPGWAKHHGKKRTVKREVSAL